MRWDSFDISNQKRALIVSVKLEEFSVRRPKYSLSDWFIEQGGPNGRKVLPGLKL